MAEFDGAYWHEGHDDYDLEKTTALQEAGWEAKDICGKAAISGIRFHDLRHTHATMLMKQGVNPKVVQERLGHSSISVTLDVYSHVVPGMQELAALAIDAALAGKKDR